jgi:uncharacterized protein (TIGR02147 family)
MKSQTTPFYKILLQQELNRRCTSNRNYSMRSFAKALAIDPAVLSRTLSDKRAMSFKVAKRIITNLGLSSQESAIFLESVAEDHKQRGLNRTNAPAISHKHTAPANELDTDQLRILNDWYHHAIQQLTLVENFDGDPRVIAKRLGITVLETRVAIQRLLKAGILKEEHGKLAPTASNVSGNAVDHGFVPVRKYQKQILTKALESLELHHENKRAINAMTLAIDADKMELARQLIDNFAQSLANVLSSGKLKSVYQLSIALSPVETTVE